MADFIHQIRDYIKIISDRTASGLAVNLEVSDIEIGAVELKNGTSDQRATVNGSGQLLVKASDLETQLTAIAGYVDGLESTASATNTNLDALTVYVDQIEGYVDGIEATISSTNTKLDSIDGHIDGLEALAVTIDADTSNIAAATANLADNITMQAPIKATGTGGVVTATVNPGVAWKLHHVRVLLSAAVNATLAGTIDDVDNAVYDVPLFSQNMASQASFTYTPPVPIPMEASPFSVAINPGASTVGIKIFYSLV